MKLASGDAFDEHDVVAEPFEATDMVAPRTLGVATIEVVSAEVGVRHAVLEHVPKRDQPS
jgi:hypothetical protein